MVVANDTEGIEKKCINIEKKSINKTHSYSISIYIDSMGHSLPRGEPFSANEHSSPSRVGKVLLLLLLFPRGFAEEKLLLKIRKGR